MKLNKFNKKLKDEFNDTIEDKIVVKETKKAFHFKFRYVLLSIAALIIIALVTDHLIVEDYNSKLVNMTSVNYQELKVTTDKYTSKNELSNALIYTKQNIRKKSALENIGSMFNMLACTSSGTKYSGSSGDLEPEGGSAPTSDVEIGTGTTPGNSYNTNNQEAGIDEADTAKCDGTYIYSLTYGCLYIFDLEGNELARETFNYTTKQLYVYNDKVIVFLADGLNIYTFDGSTLTLSKEYKNRLVDSRLVDNNLFLITIESLNLDRINYDNAYYDGSVNPYYLYKIYRLNLNNIDDNKEANLVSTSSVNIYMSDNYLYFTTSYYNTCTNIFIIDYDLNGYAAIKESGYALNQYSFSEYNGMFRYVLTDRTKTIYNSIYVYDLANKKLAGSLLNQIGLERELVKSVRFEKNICYVCTYRNTDPLYEIDLSDPTNITIKSELHVAGYSGYLHYFVINDKKYVLGTGYDDSGYPKISIYEQTEDDLVQVGKNLVISPYEQTLLFDSIQYVPQDLDYYSWNALVNSYRGYRFYFVDDVLYFGSPITNNTYSIFKIDLKEEDPIRLYKEHIYEKKDLAWYNNLRCFIVNSKLYFVGNGSISIEEF